MQAGQIVGFLLPLIYSVIEIRHVSVKKITGIVFLFIRKRVEPPSSLIPIIKNEYMKGIEIRINNIRREYFDNFPLDAKCHIENPSSKYEKLV
ncbi:MAG: hypothetical protein CVU90_15230 [Firmicutes bacterium HGW-Firmicutes-15]|nr:MAG: hypothetical protein CVV46_13875 [Spirochaetae bacterium HGW-Spirochaetae-2]PKM75895.1 MAG: hypothetical protein CVU90_15230 [Firmicutes bacterium HGW-Firmicutes-15]